MRYNFILLLFAFKTTHCLVTKMNGTNRKDQTRTPKIIASSQIPTKNKNNDTGIHVKNIITPPSRPPVAFMVDFVF